MTPCKFLAKIQLEKFQYILNVADVNHQNPFRAKEMREIN